MRISTPLLFQKSVSAISTQQSDLLRLQQQIAAGKRLLTAGDDPVAAAQALVVREASAENDRYGDNIAVARDLLNQNESALASITEVLQSVRTTVVSAGSTVLSANDRAALASEIGSRLSQLVGLANSRDGNGNFLFSGFQSSTQPFTGGEGAPVTYNGDQGVKSIQVAPTRFMNVERNGASIFEMIKNGNGTFAATPASTNTGTGVVGSTAVSSAAALTGDTYRLQFNVTGSSTTYDVIDVTTSATISTGNSYTSGSSINVAGMSVAITGAPANADRFTLAPSSNQSIFATLQKLITALQSPTATDAQRTSFTNNVNDALQNVDNGLENVLTLRSDVGAKLRELDALSTSGEDRGLQYQQTLSRLEDLDYNRALSLFAQQQLALEAAQKSFVKTSGLSLFAFL